MKALVYGMAITSESTARALLQRGAEVLVADDLPTDQRREAASALGLELIERPGPDDIDALVRSVDVVAPAPGVPESHPVVRAALSNDIRLSTELDLAYEWEQQRPGGPRPMVAITGTDGKTTTTTMVASILTAAGLRCAAVGNTEVPLVTALDSDAEAFAVECSSFRLSWLRSFRADAAIWLNLAPDHQNWHASMDSYIAAKSNVWRLQRPDDVAIGFHDDPVVMAHLDGARARHVTFGLDEGDYHVAEHDSGDARSTWLLARDEPVMPVSGLPRSFPHDVTNALSAAAACIEGGWATAADVATGLATYAFPPHRIEPVGEAGGVRWYNDSKATTPHAAITAIRAFPSLVLIAGGRNKGLDLSQLATEAHRVRTVIAIGDATDDIEVAFTGRCPVVRAGSMAAAVSAAGDAAKPGDAVLLSPACASFDWYPSGGYPARGDDFRSCVASWLEVNR